MWARSGTSEAGRERNGSFGAGIPGPLSCDNKWPIHADSLYELAALRSPSRRFITETPSSGRRREKEGEQGGQHKCASQAIETSPKRACRILQPPDGKRADNTAQATGGVDERQTTSRRNAREELRRDAEERRTSRAEPGERDGEANQGGQECIIETENANPAAAIRQAPAR